MSRRLRDILHFGPEAKAPAQKEGGEAEACRPRDTQMLNILARTVPEKTGTDWNGQELPENFIRDGFVRLGASQAEIVLRDCKFEHQRRIDPNHVSVLKDLMARGQWLDRDKLDFARLNGKIYLVNGYHRMTAQAATGKRIEWTIVIHDCADDDAVRRLYWSFDTNTRSRSNHHILEASHFAEKIGVNKTLAVAVYKAIPLVASRLSVRVADRDILSNRVVDRRLNLAFEFAAEAAAFANAIDGCEPKLRSKLLNGGITAVALLTFRYRPSQAAIFWRDVAQNDGLRKGDPRKAFITDSLTRNFKAGSTAQLVATATIAWNAFCEGRQLKIIKVPSSTPPRLYGMPASEG